MYKYTKKALVSNFLFVALLLYLIVFVNVEWIFKFVLVFVVFMITRDAVKEYFASFELTGDRLIIKNKDRVVREIKYKDMKYLTITRRNKHWIVIADDERILFTIKPKIGNYEDMVGELMRLNRSNKKLEVHDYIKRTYKKPQ